MEKKAFPSLFALVGLLSEFGAGAGNCEFVSLQFGILRGLYFLCAECFAQAFRFCIT